MESSRFYYVGVGHSNITPTCLLIFFKGEEIFKKICKEENEEEVKSISKNASEFLSNILIENDIHEVFIVIFDYAESESRKDSPLFLSGTNVDKVFKLTKSKLRQKHLEKTIFKQIEKAISIYK